MKPILYIDMDGVIADFESYMHQIAPGIPIGDGPDWEERSKIVVRACQQNFHLFEKLKPIQDGVSSVMRLMTYYDVYFLSTPMEAVVESYTDKRKWLDRYFGGLADKKLILTHRKDLAIGDYLVDDSLRNGAAQFTGEHIHFGTEDFPDWKSVTSYLLSKTQLKQAA